MIKTSGRTDVMVQWFSNEFVRDHHELFKKVVINPSEIMMIVKDGVPQELFTETSNKILPSFMGKIKELFVGQKDLQVFFIDLKPKTLSLPISGFSKDRTEIKGTTNIVFRVSKNNLIKLFNLLSRDLVSDSKWGRDIGKIKEVCEEDIANIFSYDSSLIINSTVLSKYESSEINDNIPRLSKEIKDALNMLIPNWANCGFDVDFSNLEITENAYEDVMKYRDLKSKDEMMKDVDFISNSKEIERIGNLDLIKIKKSADIEVENVVTKVRMSKTALSGEMEEKLMKVDNDVEIERKLILSKLDSAKTRTEIEEIEGRSKSNIDRMVSDTRHYSENLQIDREERRQKLEIDKMHAGTEDTIKILETKNKQSIEKAYSDGYNDGKSDGMKESSELEYSKGYNEGFIKGGESARSMMNILMNDRVNAYGETRKNENNDKH